MGVSETGEQIVKGHATLYYICAQQAAQDNYACRVRIVLRGY